MHLDHQVAESVDPQHVARRKDGSRAVLGDDGGTGEGVTGVEFVPFIEAGFVGRAIEIDGARADECRRAVAFKDALTRRLEGLRGCDQAHTDVDDFERRGRVGEAVAPFVQRVKCGHHVRAVGDIQLVALAAVA